MKQTTNIDTYMTRQITRLVLSQDDYQILLEALQQFFKSPRVTSENFDGLRNLYGHIKEAYSRRTPEEVVVESKPVAKDRTLTITIPTAKKKVGVKKAEVIEVPEEEQEQEIEAHPFRASKKHNWICQDCGKSRNSSYHKNAEGKLWMAKKS